MNKYMNEISQRDVNKTMAVEKMIYQFEPIGGNLAAWDKNLIALARFYAMCGNGNFRHLINWDSVLIRFDELYRNRKVSSLPCHNAIAFFQKFMELDLPKPKLQYMLWKLFPCAISSHGFVFGTAFCGKNVDCVRPCDLTYIVPWGFDYNMTRDILMSQAQLKCGNHFLEERVAYDLLFSKIDQQKQRIEKWILTCRAEEKPGAKDFPRPWRTDLDLSEKKFWDFFECYQEYCKKQFSRYDTEQYKTAEIQLCQIEQSARFIFRMERMLRRLHSLKEVSNRQQHLAEKQKWVEDFRRELSSPSTPAELESMSAVAPKISPQSLNTGLYSCILNPLTPSKLTQKAYPLLNPNAVFRKLNSEEETCLYWYRKHPVARTIDHLCRGPRRESFRRVLPFYLLDHFMHQEKPLRPFTRKTYHFYPEHLHFTGDISFSKHSRSVRLQESHHDFYQSLLMWCDQYYTKVWDLRLCNDLYTFYRPHLVTAGPTEGSHHLPDYFSRLKSGLEQVFDVDVDMFPQYVGMQISSNEFYRFFYIDSSPVVKELRRRLYVLVTDEVARQYKEMAFLHPDGLGNSRFPKTWHQDLAAWLSDLIEKDEEVCKYAYCPDVERSPHLAQIELSIQLICCQRIREKMVQEVLRYCKGILSPG